MKKRIKEILGKGEFTVNGSLWIEGKPLPAGKGPLRLIVPGEKLPARSCFKVVELVIRFRKE